MRPSTLSLCPLLFALALAPGAQAQLLTDSDAALPRLPGNSPVLRTLNIETFTVEDGLPSNSVSAMVQDSLGFLWVATWEGLARYDGSSFRLYAPDPADSTSLSFSRLETLYLDGDALWVGTMGGGLDRFDPAAETFTHHRHDPDDPTSLSSNTVHAVLRDRNGTLWVGTEGGLNKFIPSAAEGSPSPSATLPSATPRAGRTGSAGGSDPETGGFTHYRHDPDDPTTLSSDFVRVLYEDRQGTLWVGTGNPWVPDPEIGGLNRYDPATDTFTRYRHDPDDPETLANNHVETILEDSRGTFWVGTLGSGIHTMDREAGTFTRYYYDPQQPDQLRAGTSAAGMDVRSLVTILDEDADGMLWIGILAVGLLHYDPYTGLVRNVDPLPDLPNHAFFRTTVTRDGARWIADLWSPDSPAGLIRITPAAQSFLHYTHEDGNPQSLSHNMVRQMHADAEGMVWITTLGGGLNRFDPTTEAFEHYRHNPNDPHSLSSDSLTSILEDREGTLWVGSVDAGLNRFDKATGRVQRYLHDPANPQTILPNTVVTSLYQDRAGALWIGTFRGGLSRLDPATGTFTHYQNIPGNAQSLPSNNVLGIQEDALGRLWVSTFQGYSVFVPQDGHFSNFIDYGSSGLYEDRQGGIWVSTTGDGLRRINVHTGEHVRYSTAQGLPALSMGRVLEDNRGTLWVSTWEGPLLNPTGGRLARFDAETGRFRALEAADGMPDVPLWLGSATRDPQGRLYFGGPKGFIMFDPSMLPERTAPDIVLTGFRLFNDPLRPLHPSEEIQLRHDQHDVTINYAGLDFSSRSPLKYQYMLEPYDAGWVNASSQQSARYGRLGPGRYVFRVRVARQGEDWAEKAAWVGIRVLPPWWRTWWAYMLYGLALFGGVFAVDRVQRRRLVARERERARERELGQAREIERAYTQLKATQAQLVQQEKLASLGQLTAGIAHEIKNPLNFINNFAEVNEELADELLEALRGGEDLEAIIRDLKQNASVIKQHGRRADGIVHAMMQHASGGTGRREPTDLNTLVSKHIDLAYHGKRAQVPDLNVEIGRDLDEGVGTVEVVPQEIGRVLLNLLGNAFDAVHEYAATVNGPYAPTVTVSTRRNGEAVEIRVSDNGPGVSPEHREKIFEPFFTTKPAGSGTGLGLSMSYDIVTQGHGGTLTVESTEGQGATFVITLPKTASQPQITPTRVRRFLKTDH